jgi:hypothetical protein
VRGIPVVGGVYFSMKNGPVTSELLDIINAGRLADEESSGWEDLVSDRKGHMVEIKSANAPIECLSEAEIQLVDEVYQEHGGMDQWQLREWCHLNCGEWTPMHGGRNTISVEEIAKNVGKSDAETQQIVEEAEESNLLGSVFSMKRPAHV